MEGLCSLVGDIHKKIIIANPQEKIHLKAKVKISITAFSNSLINRTKSNDWFFGTCQYVSLWAENRTLDFLDNKLINAAPRYSMF
jgi:hypothetical protein